MVRVSGEWRDGSRFLPRHAPLITRHLFVLGVWRIAHDPAKVGDQVRLLTRIFDAGAQWPGDRLQPGFKWVRFPPASLTANCRFGLHLFNVASEPFSSLAVSFET